MASLLSDLQACLGSDRVLTDAMALAPLLLDNRGRWQGRALCAVFPSTTEEVSEIMRIACRHNALVFAQGGNTGNAAAATPVVNDTDVSRTVLLSTTRLRRIEKIDTVNDSVVVQAGVPVAALRETAALQKRLFALSLASDGTATVGGVLATNAGGVHVLRYGNARDLCLGLEVVLCDGRVLDLMRGLRKDNTGYDLKSLFIGSEGTLGIITKAVLKLHPLPASRKVLWLSLDSLRKIEPLFCAFQKQAGHALSAFEIVHQTPLQRVAQVFPEKIKKIDTHSPWSVLVELSYSDTQDETQGATFSSRCLKDFSNKESSPTPFSRKARSNARRFGQCAKQSLKRTRRPEATSSTTSACREAALRSSSNKPMQRSQSVFPGSNRVFSVISETAISTTIWASFRGRIPGFVLPLKRKSTPSSTNM